MQTKAGIGLESQVLGDAADAQAADLYVLISFSGRVVLIGVIIVNRSTNGKETVKLDRMCRSTRQHGYAES